MTWEGDAKRGHLGRRPPPRAGLPAQPLHEGVPARDRDAVLLASAEALRVWQVWKVTDGAPLYEGGTLDCWPAWVVEMLTVAKSEWSSIETFLTWEAQQPKEG